MIAVICINAYGVSATPAESATTMDPDLASKIVGGEEATQGQFPYQVSKL